MASDICNLKQMEPFIHTGGRDFNDIKEWFQENLMFILQDDEFLWKYLEIQRQNFVNFSYKMDLGRY